MRWVAQLGGGRWADDLSDIERAAVGLPPLAFDSVAAAEPRSLLSDGAHAYLGPPEGKTHRVDPKFAS
jgi:hypothetical protein